MTTRKKSGTTGTKPAGRKPSARLAKNVQVVLASHGVSTTSSHEVAAVLGEKLGRLKKVEEQLAEYTKENTRQAEMITELHIKLADARSVAKEAGRLAAMLKNRVTELRKRDADCIALIGKLIGQRMTFLKGGPDAVQLCGLFNSVSQTGAPEGFDKPSPRLMVDIIPLKAVHDNTKPMHPGAIGVLEALSHRPADALTRADLRELERVGLVEAEPNLHGLHGFASPLAELLGLGDLGGLAELLRDVPCFGIPHP